MPLKVVIADDHPLILQALATTLEGEGIEVVAQAADGEAAWQAVSKWRPDVVVLDLKMPGRNGVEVARAVKHAGLPTRVVLLSYFLESYLAERAAEFGVHGYLLKENPPEVILHAVREVAAGETVIDARIERTVAEQLSPIRNALATLTPTERKLLLLVAAGKTTREIAGLAFVSARTVEKHRANIAVKLAAVRKDLGLAEWAVANRRLLE